MKQVARCCAMVCLLTLARNYLGAAEITILKDLSYKSGVGLTDYERERCKLDLYLPTNHSFPMFIWFHGGSLTGGSKESNGETGIGRSFAQEGIAVATVNYRLNAKVSFPAYCDDAAAAVAWVITHIGEHGGDTNRVFVGGHSAGAYLTSMLGMNPLYLKKYGLDRAAIAGLIPVSGQMMTHFTVRNERGLGTNNITADDAAPIYYTSSNAPPMLIIMGDHDWPARVEENQYFVAMQKVAGNRRITFLQIPDRDHGSIAGRIPRPNDPAREAILKFIRETP